MPLEHEGIYPKYLVFKHPDFIPVGVSAWVSASLGEGVEMSPLHQVEDFVFVLKPDSDVHARIAIAAYAESVRQENDQLSVDLFDVLASLL